MKVEFVYPGGEPQDNLGVLIERDSHESARRAKWAADKIGLSMTVFSYSGILEQVADGQDPVEYCAQVTGTQYEEQIKALFVSDASLDGKHRPNSAVGVLKYPDRLDYKKLAAIIAANANPLRRRNRVIGRLIQNWPGLETLGIVPEYLGINQQTIYVPEFVTAPSWETFDPYTDKFLSMHVIDESLRELPRFCMLVGFQKADALVVIDGRNGRLGSRLDDFFRSYFGGSSFVIADIQDRKR